MVKAVPYPKDFIPIVDTREQNPLFARKNSPKGLVFKRDKLDTGDYSLLGFEDSGIVVERKSIPDLYGSLGKGRKNFVANLERMAKFEWAGLLIEGTEEDVLNPSESRSNIHPNSVKGALISIRVRYGVHICFAANKNYAEDWVLGHFLKWYRIKRGG